jgi:hypothetical protein
VVGHDDHSALMDSECSLMELDISWFALRQVLSELNYFLQLAVWYKTFMGSAIYPWVVEQNTCCAGQENLDYVMLFSGDEISKYHSPVKYMYRNYIRPFDLP